jgi:hypothetical protein
LALGWALSAGELIVVVVEEKEEERPQAVC